MAEYVELPSDEASRGGSSVHRAAGSSPSTFLSRFSPRKTGMAMPVHRLIDRAGRSSRERERVGAESGRAQAVGKPRTLERQPTRVGSVAELMAAGFTLGQAEGIIAGRAAQGAARGAAAGGRDVATDLPQLAELKNVGFTPDQLRDVGFSPAVLRGAGFSPGEVRCRECAEEERARACARWHTRTHAPSLLRARPSHSRSPAWACACPSLPRIDRALPAHASRARCARAYACAQPAPLRCSPAARSMVADAPLPPPSHSLARSLVAAVGQLREAGVLLQGAGFTAAELLDEGYTVGELKEVGFKPGALRMQVGATLASLKEAGFTAQQFKSDGFGPGEMKEAGFELAAIKQAGFTPVQLSKKAGYTLRQLREAGYPAVEVKAIGGVTAEMMYAGGFTTSQVKAAFSKVEIADNTPSHGSGAPKSVDAAARAALEAARSSKNFALPEKRRPGLEALDSADGDGTAVSGPMMGPSGALYTSTSLCCLRPRHPLRKAAIKTVEAWWFEPLIMLTILVNCTTMAWESNLDPPGTPKAALIAQMETAYLYIYTTEMGLKILARGFALHRNAYLRDPWSILDFVVVTTGWLGVLPPELRLPAVSANLSVMRALRVLRFLRALKMVPGMPQLVQAVLNVMPAMANVSLLCAFVFLVFGIVGMELFKGSLHYRCAADGYVETAGHPALDGVVVGGGGGRRALRQLGRALKGGGGGGGGAVDEDAFDTEVACNPSRTDQCEAGTACAYFDDNPSAGLMSFDNVPMAMVILLQTVTFDDWATPMYALMEASSPNVWIYFVLLCAVGGFFVVELFLAVIFEEFLQTKRIDQSTKDMEGRTPADDSGSSSSPDGGGAPAGSGAPPVAESTQLLAPSAARSDDASTREGLLVLAASDTPGRRLVDDLIEQRRDDGAASGGGLLRRIALSSTLTMATTALVLLNVLLMAMPYEGMSRSYGAALETSTTVITWLFIIEMAIKLLGLGCVGYWSDGWNALDGTIVVMSVSEIVATDLLMLLDDGAVPKLSFLRILRMLRIVRVLRLMRTWKGLYKIVVTLGKAIPQMANMFVMMVICMVIFALLGMQIFGGIYVPANGFSQEACPAGLCADPELEELPHYNFDYFGGAMMTSFILMTGEWADAMGPAAEVVGTRVILYFVVAVLVGRYLVMNLFIGILLNAFGDDDEEEESAPPPAAAPSAAGSLAGSVADDDSVMGDGADAPAPAPAPAEWRSGRMKAALADVEAHASASHGREADPPWPEDHSLFLFPPSSLTRRLCRWLVTRPLFDPCVILMIIGSSVTLALDNPRNDPTTELSRALRTLDMSWTILFTLEMILKVVAQGFFFSRNPYIRSPWNQLDFTIVTISALAFLAESIPQLRPLRSLRVLRALRPLRLVSRVPGMKIIVTSLTKALPDVSNAFGVVLAIQLVFAILGMQLYMGAMASCTNPAYTTRSECIHEPPSPPPLPLPPPPPLPGALAEDSGDAAALALATARRTLKGGGDAAEPVVWDGSESIRWINPAFGSFDNIGEAMRLLYIMGSGDFWEAPMWVMQAAVGPGQAPVRNDYDPTGAIFCVVWMFVGSFFALNLFIGVICDSFDRIRKETDQSATMTKEQQQWVEAMRAMAKQAPSRGIKPPSFGPCKWLYAVVTSQAFDGVITTVIIGNVLLMACNYWGIEQDASVHAAYEQAMRGFIFIYYGECALKVLALGLRGYFGDGWCRFDFFLVCTALVDDFVEQDLRAVMPLPPYLLRVLRVFRVLRILRLLKGAKGLRNLIVTMVLSFPSLINVGSLLCLVIFIYAVLGIHMFAYLLRQEAIDDARNFESLGGACLLLFQCLTGDAWSELMGDAMLDEASGKCSNTLPGTEATFSPGNCGSPLAIPYFVSFQVVGVFVFLNLVVAVILENFSSMSNLNPHLASSSDIEGFKEIWAEYDPDADQYIPSKELPNLVMSLPPPMGLLGYGEHSDAIKMCTQLKLTQTEGKVAFQDVLNALTRNSFFNNKKIEFSPNELEELVPPEVLELPKTPPPPKVAPLDTRSASKSRLVADKFVTDLPSVRRVFALQVIEKHAQAWSTLRRQAQGRRTGGGGTGGGGAGGRSRSAAGPPGATAGGTARGNGRTATFAPTPTPTVPLAAGMGLAAPAPPSVAGWSVHACSGVSGSCAGASQAQVAARAAAMSANAVAAAVGDGSRRKGALQGGKQARTERETPSRSRTPSKRPANSSR